MTNNKKLIYSNENCFVDNVSFNFFYFFHRIIRICVTRGTGKTFLMNVLTKTMLSTLEEVLHVYLIELLVPQPPLRSTIKIRISKIIMGGQS